MANFDRNYTFKELIYCTNENGALINFQTRLVDAADSSKTLDLSRFGPAAISNATANCTSGGLPTSAAIKDIEIFFGDLKLVRLKFFQYKNDDYQTLTSFGSNYYLNMIDSNHTVIRDRENFVGFTGKQTSNGDIF